MNRAASLVAVLALVCGCSRPPEPPDRSKPPALGPAPELKLPPIQKATLSNGLPVLLVESHEVPLVQVNLLILTGSADDPAGKFGIASLTAAMLDEGAGQRTALQIADDVEFLGAALETSSSFDASAVRLNVPSARLEAALPIMADVALRPTFPQAELERLRQERLTTLIQARDDAAQVAPLAFSRVVFGGMHRYGTAAMGTPSTLKAFTTWTCERSTRRCISPSSATLVVVGDVKSRRRAAAAREAVRRLEGRGGICAHRGTGAHRRSSPQRQVTIVDLPGAEQSQVRIGWVGVPRSTPDYFTLQVLNTILGGSFTSRLNQNLREKNQFTYGASSRFDMRLAAGPFFAGAGIQTDKTVDALREFFNELNAIAHAGERGGTGEGQELHRAQLSERVRDDRGSRLAHRGDGRLQAAGQLLRALRRQHPGRHRGRGAEGGRHLHPAGQLRGRHRRRSQGHRGRRQRAEARSGAGPERRRGRLDHERDNRVRAAARVLGPRAPEVARLDCR